MKSGINTTGVIELALKPLLTIRRTLTIIKPIIAPANSGAIHRSVLASPDKFIVI